jgi:hypothetical protein
VPLTSPATQNTDITPITFIASDASSSVRCKLNAQRQFGEILVENELNQPKPPDQHGAIADESEAAVSDSFRWTGAKVNPATRVGVLGQYAAQDREVISSSYGISTPSSQ